MEPQSILSEKGKKLLVVNNYKFGKAKSQAADFICVSPGTGKFKV
jgi:hypothetical protein